MKNTLYLKIIFCILVFEEMSVEIKRFGNEYIKYNSGLKVGVVLWIRKVLSNKLNNWIIGKQITLALHIAFNNICVPNGTKCMIKTTDISKHLTDSTCHAYPDVFILLVKI